MIVVLGATGHTGRVLAETLARGDERVRVGARDRSKLAALEKKLGAEPCEVDLLDPDSTLKALTGAMAAYLLIPPNFGVDDFGAYQDRVRDSLVYAVQRSGVRNLVVLSSLGANLEKGTGPIVGLHRLEQALREIPGLNALVLRAGFFMENFLTNIASIKERGTIGLPMPGSVKLELVATRDIAAYAAKRLTALDFTRWRVENLIGPRLYALDEVATILGGAIGKPELSYVPTTEREREAAMAAMGVHPKVATVFSELSRAEWAGLLAPEPGTKTVRGPTSLEDFAPTFAAAFNG